MIAVCGRLYFKLYWITDFRLNLAPIALLFENGGNRSQHRMESGGTPQESNFDSCVPFSVSDTSFLESVIDAARGSPTKGTEEAQACELSNGDLTLLSNLRPSESHSSDSSIITDNKPSSLGHTHPEYILDDGCLDLYGGSLSSPYIQSLGSKDLAVDNMSQYSGSPGHGSPPVASANKVDHGLGIGIPMTAALSSIAGFSYGFHGNQHQMGPTVWGAPFHTKVAIVPPVNCFSSIGSPLPQMQPSPRWSPNSSGYFSGPSSPTMDSPADQHERAHYHLTQSCSQRNINSPWSFHMKPCPGKPYWEQMRTMASGLPVGYTLAHSAFKQNHPCQMDAPKYVNMASNSADSVDSEARQKASNDKPCVSFVEMIAKALIASPEKKLLLADIYQYVLDNYPYYRSARKTWRNAIRHNLSVNECFVKAGRSNYGRGHYWAVHPACIDMFTKGDFRRHQARKVAQHMSRDAKALESVPCQRMYNAQVNFYNDMMYHTQRGMMI